MNNSFLFAAAAALALSGCAGSQNGGTDETPVTPELTQVWKTDTVFTGSESTLYDPSADVIYVSNGNTKAGEKDNDGFISVVNTDGTVRNLRWAEGNLHAPKGMALIGGKLYVTDIDEVKIIDVASASIEKTIAVDSAVFLNDVATDGQQVYFSDSRTGRIYALATDGSYETISTTNTGVNGLECHAGHLYALDGEGLKKFSSDGSYTQETINTQVTGGDGLVILNDSTFVASRWHGEIFFIRGSETTVLLDTQAEKSNTADIGFVPGKNLVIVPTFLKNEVAAYELAY
ncbi:YncE family protein [Parapedobacter pyrenivorans]|uniref:YncE family protein n=1 Tax=Parapedobacter pyrenivorans TaxID=1305674 RepID=UPI003341EB34